MKKEPSERTKREAIAEILRTLVEIWGMRQISRKKKMEILGITAKALVEVTKEEGSSERSAR